LPSRPASSCRSVRPSSTGPDGLVGTDHLCPETIARRAGENRRIIVAPTIAYGMSQFHLGFPGTIALRPSTLTAMLLDIIASLGATGFRRIYFSQTDMEGTSAHCAEPCRNSMRPDPFSGEPTPVSLHCRIRSWWELPTVDAMRRKLYGSAEGYHATPK